MSSTRKLFVSFSVVAFAVVAAAGGTAATGKHASAKSDPPVKVQVFAPRPGDAAGKASKGFFVDLAAPVSEPRVERSRLPADRTGDPPEPGPVPRRSCTRRRREASRPDRAPLDQHGRCQECPEPRQPLQPDGLHEPEGERDLGHLDRRSPALRQERPIGAAGRRCRRQEQGRVYNDAPAIVPDANHDGRINAIDLKAYGVASSIVTVPFQITD